MGIYSRVFSACCSSSTSASSPIETGLAFLPQTMTLAVMSLGLSNRLMRVFRAKPTSLAGCALIFVGLVLFALATPRDDLLPSAVRAPCSCWGVGSSMAFTPLAKHRVGPYPQGRTPESARASSAWARRCPLRSLWPSSVSCLTNRTSALLATGSSVSHALTGGYRLGFVVAAAFVVVGALICMWFVPSGPAPSVEASPTGTHRSTRHRGDTSSVAPIGAVER